VDSVESDRQSFQAKSLTVSNQSLYNVHEIQNDTTKIREISDKNGVVFAVIWDGQIHPDFSNLFGNYFKDYIAAMKERKKKMHFRTHSSRLQTENLVVIQSGHMKSMHGRAYVPALVPKGVNVDEIQ